MLTTRNLVDRTAPIGSCFGIKRGTAMPYGCNDNIKGIMIFFSSGNSEINLMLFDIYPRNKRSHDQSRRKPRGNDAQCPATSYSLSYT